MLAEKVKHLGVDGHSTRGLGGARGAVVGQRDRVWAVRGTPVDAALRRLVVLDGAGLALTPVTVLAQSFSREVLLLAVSPIRADFVDHRLLRARGVLPVGLRARKLVEVCQRLRYAIELIILEDTVS